MSFIVLCVYRPPNAASDFYTGLTKILKTYERKEILLMGDLNINWLDKGKRKHLKDIVNSIQMTQLIKKPTRITKTSQTLIDLIFTNKPDRIVKTYNLITGLSDHNFVLIARKLNKSRYINKEQSNKQCKIPHIPKRNQEHLKNDLN